MLTVVGDFLDVETEMIEEILPGDSFPGEIVVHRELLVNRVRGNKGERTFIKWDLDSADGSIANAFVLEPTCHRSWWVNPCIVPA